MKIITDNGVYVQKNDIVFLLKLGAVMLGSSMPHSILAEVFRDGAFIVDDSNRFEFIKFNNPKEIEFFQSLDWILDYNEIKDLTEEDMVAFAQSVLEKRNGIAQNFNAMSQEKRKMNIEMIAQCKKLEYKIGSIMAFQEFKKGYITMDLPDEVNLPADSARGKSIRRLIKNLFNKKPN